LHWKTGIGIGLGMMGLAIFFKGYVNSKKLDLTRVALAIPDLSLLFDGFRLLFLTDLHFRPRSPHVEQLLALINELQPDLVCLGGDYVIGPQALPEIERFFATLSTRDNVVGIYGNTDYRHVTAHDRRHWADLLPFLTNSAVCLERDGQHLWVAGVDDPHLGADDLPLALRDVPPATPVLLLAHSPEVLRHQLDPRVRLILCGHTHGGQICLPGGRALYNNMPFPPELSSGLHQVNDAQLYVSRGIGSTRIPVRFNCLPEAVLFTLTRGGEGG